MTFLWIKQSVKLFLMLFNRETLARSIIPFSQWVQASSKGSPPRGILGFACKQHFSSRPPWIIFKRVCPTDLIVTPLLTRSHECY